MPEIPVGSPPAPPGRHAAPGGWYVDPVDRTQERYWDGWQWARNTRPREAFTPAPPGPTGPGQRPIQPAGPLTAGSRATTADGVPLAPWLWRALAAVIDTVFISIVVTLLTLPLTQAAAGKMAVMINALLEAQRSGAAAPPLDLVGLYTTQQRWVLMGVMLGVGLAYHAFFLRRKSATVGKLICGLKVVPVDQGEYAGRLTWGVIMVRALIWLLPGVVGALSLFALADALFPLWQAKRQAIHDVVAKTQVVRPARR